MHIILVHMEVQRRSEVQTLDLNSPTEGNNHYAKPKLLNKMHVYVYINATAHVCTLFIKWDTNM